jgi:uncharacterized protein YcbX
MTQTVIGPIVSLWRYPLKSMLREELNAVEVTNRGLLGDRAYALVDIADGKVASAKNPRKPNFAQTVIVRGSTGYPETMR